MLTRFFGTSKPSVIIVVLLYMTVGFFYSNKAIFIEAFSMLEVLKVIGMWVLFVFAMFILNFISQKNDLTKRSAYRTLLFAAFGLAIPVALRDASILLAGIFVLLSIRRLISLRSGLFMERKIFDATFWICIASVSYFFSWYFIIALYLTMLFYSNVQLRHLFIPLIAILSFVIIGYALVLGLERGGHILSTYPSEISLDFSAYNNAQVLIAIAFLLGVLTWTIWNYLGEQRRASTSSRSRYSVILSILLVGTLLIILAPHKTGAEWYFVLPVLSIIVSNYLETNDNLIFKESLLWLIIVLPVIINLV